MLSLTLTLTLTLELLTGPPVDCGVLTGDLFVPCGFQAVSPAEYANYLADEARKQAELDALNKV